MAVSNVPQGFVIDAIEIVVISFLLDDIGMTFGLSDFGQGIIGSASFLGEMWGNGEPRIKITVLSVADEQHHEASANPRSTPAIYQIQTAFGIVSISGDVDGYNTQPYPGMDMDAPARFYR